MGTIDASMGVEASQLDESMLDALFDGHVDDQPQQEQDSPELRAVSRRIAMNYVEVLADASQRLLQGGDPEYPLASLRAAITDLTRLSRATHDLEMQERLDELSKEVQLYSSRRQAGRGHSKFRDFLRDWLGRFATCADDESGETVLHVVEFDLDEIPVFNDLLHLPGIGPRRLRRLYAAGLYDAETIAKATPDDMAAVTGLPRSLCEDVSARARRNIRERAESAITNLPNYLAAFWAAFEEPEIEWSQELHEAARRALLHLRLAGERAGEHEVPRPVRGNS